MTEGKIKSYVHKGSERLNNPPVGLAGRGLPEEPDVYRHDPHLDPLLCWAGKEKHASFEVPRVALHVHERIDPLSVIAAVKKGNGKSSPQPSLFDDPEENPPIRKAIEFYQHKHNWSNRLIAGDSLLVMNSLIEKEDLGEKVQMVYIDPPYGIKYGSNYQPFVDKKDVKDGKDKDLTHEPEMIRAFRDTWEQGIHSYLSYLRDRLHLARLMLNETGSCFVQISEDNLHLVRILLDEVFGASNFVSLVTFKTTSGASKKQALKRIADYLLWYAKDKEKMKFKQLYKKIEIDTERFNKVEDSRDGSRRSMTREEKDEPDRIAKHLIPYCTQPVHSKSEGDRTPRMFEGKQWKIHSGSWRFNKEGFSRLCDARRIVAEKRALRSIYYFIDFGYTELTNNWIDTFAVSQKQFVVQTSAKVIERCVLMCSDPGDLIFDPTCGSGTTAYVAEKWGRRWITCDTSRIALAIAKQRLVTATYDYFTLAHPDEGIGGGFVYDTVRRVRLKDIAHNPLICKGMSREKINEEVLKGSKHVALVDNPKNDQEKSRVTGPFTCEAVPAAKVQPVDSIEPISGFTIPSIARTGETLRQHEWREELLKTGIIGKSKQHIRLTRIEPLAGTKWLHADGEIPPPPPCESAAVNSARRAVISFGPEHAPLGNAQVEHAIQEAEKLVPKPRIVVFAAFHFDPEAAKNIDETKWPNVTLIKALMNPDLLTEDLKKKRTSNQSFWLIGQPDIDLVKLSSDPRGRKGEADGENKFRVKVKGFDYYNTISGKIESGEHNQIAMWMLDPDYDGRSLFPTQIFFPMEIRGIGWDKLAKTLASEIDTEKIEQYRGCVSLPFEWGEHKRAAVKIIDARGVESLKIIDLEQ